MELVVEAVAALDVPRLAEVMETQSLHMGTLSRQRAQDRTPSLPLLVLQAAAARLRGGKARPQRHAASLEEIKRSMECGEEDGEDGKGLDGEEAEVLAEIARRRRDVDRRAEAVLRAIFDDFGHPLGVDEKGRLPELQLAASLGLTTSMLLLRDIASARLQRAGEEEGARGVDAVRAVTERAAFHAAINGHWSLVRQLYERRGLRPATSSAACWHELMRAAASTGNVGAARWLRRVWREAREEERDEKKKASMVDDLARCTLRGGGNVLHVAASIGSIAMVRWFVVECGFGVHFLDSNGETALHIAARGDYARLCLFLLRLGLDPNTCNAQGATALHVAASHGHTGVLAVLLEEERTIRDARLPDGRTASGIARDRKQEQAMALLVAAGVGLGDCRSCDSGDCTAEHLEAFLKETLDNMAGK